MLLFFNRRTNRAKSVATLVLTHLVELVWLGCFCFTAIFDNKAISAAMQFNLVILRTVQKLIRIFITKFASYTCLFTFAADIISDRFLRNVSAR